MHSTYDEQRILDWIAKRDDGEHFTRDTVINHLSPISFSLVDYILDREVERGSIYQSGPTGKYYMKKDSYRMDTGIEEARRVVHWIDMLRDDRTFTRKDVFNELNGDGLPVPMSVIDNVLDWQVINGKVEVVSSMSSLMRTVLRKVKKVDNEVRRQLDEIEALLKKISEKVDALPDKKPRLWRPMTHSTDHNSPAFFAVNGSLIDVMLASGEVVTKMERTRVPVRDYPDDPRNVIAWRESE